jgi:hypothetical protein
MIGVVTNQNPFKQSKKKKKKKEKKTWPSAPFAAKNTPLSPALAPRSRSGAAGAEYRGILM